jgi:hypothetical protein
VAAAEAMDKDHDVGQVFNLPRAMYGRLKTCPTGSVVVQRNCIAVRQRHLM